MINIQEEAARAVRFGNEALAHQWIAQADDAALEAAEKACIHYDYPIRIREMARALPKTAAIRPSPSAKTAGRSSTARNAWAVSFAG